ncbi:MAG: bifunctional pyr operon transcriptional regulator/uracil phosphoribosyltransferase PyrR [Clostridia bacterium]|nr:bifunctional pyr operon transcriptional regulator/uracil phosphoribosyltransferase PyrR [Clostridia bacterium]
MVEKALLMDELAVRRAMARITHEIIEKNRGVESLCIMGAKKRGVPLALMLKDNIKRFENADVPFGVLDISTFRDDISPEEQVRLLADCHFPCDLHDKLVILVDDVLYTGRTARAAMESVFAYARPRAIQLAVLIDRGHRELPIRPDYVGKNIPTSKNERISVRLADTDSDKGVYLCTVDDAG